MGKYPPPRKVAARLSLLLASILVLFGCEQELEVASNQQTASPLSAEEYLAAEGLIKTKLGKQLENPYSVTNMQRALESLKAASPNGKIATQDIKIKTTNYYVRFAPKTNEELSRLEADSLHLYDYPLDYEIDSMGDYYIDPDINLEKGDNKWFYTAVPIDYSFPAMKYEILEELFLPDENALKSSQGRVSMNSLYELEDEALKLTGNWEERIEKDIDNAKISAYQKGFIRVWNTALASGAGGWEGVEGIRVRTRRWYYFGRAWTRADGYYKTDRDFKRKCHYKIFFKNSTGFKIWSSMINVTFANAYLGKHTSNGISINIPESSRIWRFATVNNATMKYRRFCTQLGIGTPPLNLHITANNKTGGGAAPMIRRTWGWVGFSTHSALLTFLGKVTISVPANLLSIVFKWSTPDVIIKANSSQKTKTVYHTTFHELAHASHYTKVDNNYWIKYINYIITYGAYGNGTGHNADICGIGEMWGNYFAAVCMDREFPHDDGLTEYLYEEKNWYNPGFLKDVDDISDVTTAEIFSCLTSNTDTFNDLRNELKNKTNYDTQIDNAWNNYTDWP